MCSISVYMFSSTCMGLTESVQWFMWEVRTASLNTEELADDGRRQQETWQVPLLSAKNRKWRLQFPQAHQHWTIEDCCLFWPASTEHVPSSNGHFNQEIAPCHKAHIISTGSWNMTAHCTPPEQLWDVMEHHYHVNMDPEPADQR